MLDKLPKRLQAKAKRALHEIMYADCRQDAEAEIERSSTALGIQAVHENGATSLGEGVLDSWWPLEQARSGFWKAHVPGHLGDAIGDLNALAFRHEAP